MKHGKVIYDTAVPCHNEKQQQRRDQGPRHGRIDTTTGNEDGRAITSGAGKALGMEPRWQLAEREPSQLTILSLEV